ncbi:DNA alkylation repair protein [Candidatus Beckwithbacteria bacterium RBG_13_35_6]|uniref:DNA alkylation repair protein n=1 Tax=Candidatus Beckwithbacteria bacterium RBG_13_35_6 TaxID=1797456 RepID=A0A1F5DGY7_9BACT|nr:MAG: DNA alkylation repair protein [Candidatus Beckwithbacteria bacterium RBG_13_35_6]
MSNIILLKQELKNFGNPSKAKIFQRFFKTGKGEYGEGDIFLGLTVPQQRKIAKKFNHLSLKQLQKLLSSKIHEYRSTALFVLIDKYKKSDTVGQREIFNFYLTNSRFINNWDLVDISAPKIIGDYIFKHPKKTQTLYKLARSNNLWQKRIAILSTFAFIKNNKLEETLRISKILINDEHDLIHKACGWMLREVGKKDEKVLLKFLNQYSHKIPRTMLRYAIEKFDEKKRKFYLSLKVLAD